VVAPEAAHGDDAKNKARTAFSRGGELFEAGEYAEAAAAFRSAYDLSPHWKLLYNIGQCEAAARNYGPALEAFESYLVSGGDEVPTDRQEEVRREIARLRDLCGEVLIDAPPGAEVFIGGIKRGRTPVVGGIPVGAGAHTVTIVLEGKVLLEKEIRVRGARTVTIHAQGEADPVPPMVAEGAEEEPGAEGEPVPALPVEGPVESGLADTVETPPNRMLVAGNVLMAVGGATLIAGAITGGVSRSKTRELEDACPDKHCADPGDKDLHDRATALTLATDVLLPVGAAFAITGAVLVFLGLRGKAAEEPVVELAPTVGPESAGLAFGGRF